MANRNITLSLPEELLKQARIIAAKRDTSVSRMVADTLKEIVERETGYEQARQRSMARLEKSFHLGTGGEANWTRDELHDRRL
ncbi:CopG family transcriptional regulator [soil metagenome]